MKIRTKTMTAADIKPGMDIENPNTGRAYFNVTVSQDIADKTLVHVGSDDGRATTLGASSMVYLLTNIGKEASHD